LYKSVESGQRYGDVERALLRIFRIDERQRGFLRGRLKHFSRLGLPGLEPGKGKKITYTRELVSQWLVALLLAEVGLDPVIIVQAIKSNWKNLAPMVVKATEPRAQRESRVFLVVKPRLMSRSQEKGVNLELSMVERYSFAPVRNSDNMLNEVNGAQDFGHWLCLIDFTSPASQLNVLLPWRS
jgi:hypothetical protein